jgi:hypothetical protein
MGIDARHEFTACDSREATFGHVAGTHADKPPFCLRLKIA